MTNSSHVISAIYIITVIPELSKNTYCAKLVYLQLKYQQWHMPQFQIQQSPSFHSGELHESISMYEIKILVLQIAFGKIIFTGNV